MLEIFKEQNIFIVIFSKEKGSAKLYRQVDPETHRCSHYKLNYYVILEGIVISKFLLSNDKNIPNG